MNARGRGIRCAATLLALPYLPALPSLRWPGRFPGGQGGFGGCNGSDPTAGSATSTA
ncbi:MAG: hypothetical protein ACJ74O_04270 [Frankiaceae bacterium]